MKRFTDRRRWSKGAVALTLLLSCLLFSACSSGPRATATIDDVLAKSNAGEKQLNEFNKMLFSAVSSAPRPEDYELAEGDLLQVTVFEAEELKREVRVGDQGTIILPLIGVVKVKGLTTRQAAEKIEQAYRKKYLQDPHVDIFVKQYQGGKITLLGALKKPGTYDYFGRQRLLDVLAMGEGLSEKAGRMVQVRRAAGDPQRATTMLIDLDNVVLKGQMEANIVIERGDVIYVADAGTVYVDGAVKRPGNLSIKPNMTVHEAIVEAGGFSTTADEKNIKLVRQVDDGKRDVIQVGIDDIRAGSASNLKLKDRDIIFVETNKLEALIYGLRLNFFSGIVGVGYVPPPQ